MGSEPESSRRAPSDVCRITRHALRTASLPKSAAHGSESKATELPVERYRRVEDMPRPWREPNDPRNLALVASLLGLSRLLIGRPVGPRISKFRSWDEALDSKSRSRHETQ